VPEASNGNGARTHEPNLREVTAELDGLRDLVLSKFETIATKFEGLDRFEVERDRRYEEAKLANKNAVDAAFAAAKEAVAEAKRGQDAYNTQHNDLQRKQDDQRHEMITRTEADQRFRAVEEKFDQYKVDKERELKELRDRISDLQLSRSAGEGAGARGISDLAAQQYQSTQSRQQSNWVIGLMVGGGIAFAGLVLSGVQLILKLLG
jgi:hypothetical protein